LIVARDGRRYSHDVADGTAATHRVDLGRILPKLGNKPVDAIAAADVAALVAGLHAGGLSRESIRKTKATAAMCSTSPACNRTWHATRASSCRERIAP